MMKHRWKKKRKVAPGLRPDNGWPEDFDPSTGGITTGHYNGALQRGIPTGKEEEEQKREIWKMKKMKKNEK